MPLFVVPLFILGVLSWWWLAAVPSLVALGVLVGRMSLRRWRRARTRWLAQRSVALAGWKTFPPARQEPALRPNFALEVPTHVALAELVAAAASRHRAVLQSMLDITSKRLLETPENHRPELSTSRLGNTDAASYRNAERWARVLVEEVLEPLANDMPISRIVAGGSS